LEISTLSPPSSSQKQIEFSALIKPPVKGSKFPVVAVNRQQEKIHVDCPDCHSALGVEFRSFKKYDLQAICECCNLHFKKSKVTTNRCTGVQNVTLVGHQIPPAPKPTGKQPVLPHPYPLIRKRSERAKSTAPQSSNKRICSRGEKELANK